MRYKYIQIIINGDDQPFYTISERRLHTKMEKKIKRSSKKIFIVNKQLI